MIINYPHFTPYLLSCAFFVRDDVFISCCMLFIILAFYHPYIIGFDSLTKIGCSELTIADLHVNLHLFRKSVFWVSV